MHACWCAGNTEIMPLIQWMDIYIYIFVQTHWLLIMARHCFEQLENGMRYKHGECHFNMVLVGGSLHHQTWVDQHVQLASQSFRGALNWMKWWSTFITTTKLCVMYLNYFTILGFWSNFQRFNENILDGSPLLPVQQQTQTWSDVDPPAPLTQTNRNKTMI
jgi:hypothetical protein